MNEKVLLRDTCKFCYERIGTTIDDSTWMDKTGGDVCSGNDWGENENESHVPKGYHK